MLDSARIKSYIYIGAVTIGAVGPQLVEGLTKAQLPWWAHFVSGLVAVAGAVRLAYSPDLSVQGEDRIPTVKLSAVETSTASHEVHVLPDDKPPMPPTTRGFIELGILTNFGALCVAFVLAVVIAWTLYLVGCSAFASHGAEVATDVASIVACVADAEAQNFPPDQVAVKCGVKTVEEVLQIYRTFDKRTLAKYPSCVGAH